MNARVSRASVHDARRAWTTKRTPDAASIEAEQYGTRARVRREDDIDDDDDNDVREDW